MVWTSIENAEGILDKENISVETARTERNEHASNKMAKGDGNAA